jgi:predicted nuclease with TOPRIM domain
VAQEKEEKVKAQEQYEELRAKASRDVQNLIADLETLRKVNADMDRYIQTLTQHNQEGEKDKQVILNSAISHERTNSELLTKIATLEEEFGHIQELLNKLKDEREVLIKQVFILFTQYVALANETQLATHQSTLNKQVQSIG